LVFIDETGTSTNMVRSRGRSRRGTGLLEFTRQECAAYLRHAGHGAT
jgi:hypothetical protein